MRCGNGAGTCYRLKGNRRKPYIARAFLGMKEVEVVIKDKKTKKPIIDDKTGKPIKRTDVRADYQTIGYYETRQDGLDALALHRHNPVTPKANMTFKELFDEWSEGQFKRITKQTADNYRAAWKHLSKHKTVKVKEVRTGHIQAVVDDCDKKGMSRSTLEKIRTTAVLMFTYAMENDIVNKNYAKFIKLPKKTKEKKDIFTEIEIKKLFDNATDEWTSTILIMIYTGLRITELLTLTRFNVNMELRLITGGIKTDAGKDRVVPIHPKIMPYIKHWYNKNGDRLICLNGKPISSKRYREEFYYPALERAEIRKLTPHKCRHTFCTMLAEAGADTLSIQKLAGHSDYGFTANTYTHPEVEQLKTAINKM